MKSRKLTVNAIETLSAIVTTRTMADRAEKLAAMEVKVGDDVHEFLFGKEADAAAKLGPSWRDMVKSASVSFEYTSGKSANVWSKTCGIKFSNERPWPVTGYRVNTVPLGLYATVLERLKAEQDRFNADRKKLRKEIERTLKGLGTTKKALEFWPDLKADLIGIYGEDKVPDPNLPANRLKDLKAMMVDVAKA